LVIVAGHGLDGQAAFAALGGALDAADGLVRRGLAAAAGGVLVVIGTAVDDLAAGARSLAGGALDLGTGGRLGAPDARATRTGCAGTTSGRLRREGRITDGFTL